MQAEVRSNSCWMGELRELMVPLLTLVAVQLIIKFSEVILPQLTKLPAVVREVMEVMGA